ncbi:MAG: PAS domain-containing protein, partial [Deltaproteobacteria bacterium]|nr:PAS domain-containing protein [Deltaproteobacteria bacterium]
LEADLQKRVLSVFHYALNHDGLLFLGTSETVGDGSDLFTTLDRHWKIYQRKDDHRRPRNTPLPMATTLRTQGPQPLRDLVPALGTLQSLTEKGLLDAYGASGLLIDEAGEVLYLHGRTGLFLELAPGEAGVNLLKMARPGLRTELAVAMRKAADTQQAVVCNGVKVQSDNGLTEVDLTVRPTASPNNARLFLVVLAPSQRPLPAAIPSTEPPFANPATASAELIALREKLRLHEAHARAQNEDLGRFNEELRSNNEELQSTIEELQSTVEELETSKEELQSVNEELITVNAELTQKLSELSRVNNDMNNLLAATGIGTIFVDFDLRIQRFTPTVTPIINLIPGDIGRPVGHIVSNLVGYDTLVADVQDVLATLVPREVEVRSLAGLWYSLRIRPYRTIDNVIEGAVITFIDVSELRLVRERKGALHE